MSRRFTPRGSSQEAPLAVDWERRIAALHPTHRALMSAANDVLDAWESWTSNLQAAPIRRTASGGGMYRRAVDDHSSSNAGLPLTIIALSTRRQACERLAALIPTMHGAEYPYLAGPVLVTDMHGLCRAIKWYVPAVYHRPEAQHVLGELHDVARSLWELAPRAGAPSILLGRCPMGSPPCGHEVRYRPGEDSARCPGCGLRGRLGEWEHVMIGPRPSLTLAELSAFLRDNAWCDISERTLHRRYVAGVIVPNGVAPIVKGRNAGVPTFDPWDAMARLLAQDEVM